MNDTTLRITAVAGKGLSKKMGVIFIMSSGISSCLFYKLIETVQRVYQYGSRVLYVRGFIIESQPRNCGYRTFSGCYTASIPRWFRIYNCQQTRVDYNN